MKLSTRQYAKSQLKWIKKQLLPAVGAEQQRRRRSAKDQNSGGGSGIQDDVLVYVLPGGESGTGIGTELLRREFLRKGELLVQTSTLGSQLSDKHLSSFFSPL